MKKVQDSDNMSNESKEEVKSLTTFRTNEEILERIETVRTVEEAYFLVIHLSLEEAKKFIKKKEYLAFKNNEQTWPYQQDILDLIIVELRDLALQMILKSNPLKVITNVFNLDSLIWLHDKDIYEELKPLFDEFNENIEVKKGLNPDDIFKLHLKIATFYAEDCVNEFNNFLNEQ